MNRGIPPKTADRLHAAIQSRARHLDTEGLLFVAPWVSPEQSWTDRVVMNIADGDTPKKVVWMYSPQREATSPDMTSTTW